MHHLIRKLLFRLISFYPTYIIGMVMLRFLRFIKNKTYKNEVQYETIDNFMGSIKMKVDKNSTMGGAIFWFGFHHISEMLYLSKVLKPGMTFVDVGANQGEFSLFAASKIKNGRILSFEPTEWQLNLLKTNVALNTYKTIEVYEYGLFDSEKTLEIFTSDDTARHLGNNEGLSSVYKSESRNVSQGIIELKVFDDIHFENLERFDFLKIDIEGAELPALRGMSKSIEKFKPIIIIEMGETTFNEAGYSISDIDLFFKPLGYKPYRFYRGRILPIDTYPLIGSDNLVFIVEK